MPDFNPFTPPKDSQSKRGSLKEFFRSILMYTFTGDENSRRCFSDYFLGFPVNFKKDDGKVKNVGTVNRIGLWFTYLFLFGFIFRPLQNIAKCIFEVPFAIVEKICQKCYSWIGRKINKKWSEGKYFKCFGYIGLMIAIGLPAALARYTLKIIRHGIIRPILSPRDNINVPLKWGKKDVGEEDTIKLKIARGLGKLCAGISCTMTLLSYSALVVLTSAFALPLMAPKLSVPFLSPTVGDFILFTAPVFHSAFTATVVALSSLGAMVAGLFHGMFRSSFQGERDAVKSEEVESLLRTGENKSGEDSMKRSAPGGSHQRIKSKLETGGYGSRRSESSTESLFGDDFTEDPEFGKGSAVLLTDVAMGKKEPQPG